MMKNLTRITGRVRSAARRLSAAPVFAVLVLLALSPGAGHAAAPVDEKLEQALLAGDWPQVAGLLAPVDERSPSPVLRFVKGHACLALNRNNESLCLFQSVSTDTQRLEWEAWTRDFLARHPDAAVARYLHGDGLARLRNWNDALAAFEGAEGPDHRFDALVFNARAVVQAARQDWTHARVDLERAAQADPAFADAHASLGTMLLQKSAGKQELLPAFGRALERSPDFALAINGRGCSKMILGDLDGAGEDLKRAKERSGDCAGSLDAASVLNLVQLASFRADATQAMLAGMARVEEGMSLERRTELMSGMNRDWVAQMKGALNNDISWNRGASSWMPDLSKIGTELKLKGGLVGAVPRLEGSLGITTEMRSNDLARTVGNMGYQRETLDLLNRMYPDIKPQTMGSLGSWNVSHKNWNLTHADAGGVTQRRIGTAPIDTPPWRVVTLYGLAYDVQPAGSDDRAEVRQP